MSGRHQEQNTGRAVGAPAALFPVSERGNADAKYFRKCPLGKLVVSTDLLDVGDRDYSFSAWLLKLISDFFTFINGLLMATRGLDM